MGEREEEWGGKMVRYKTIRKAQEEESFKKITVFFCIY